MSFSLLTLLAEELTYNSTKLMTVRILLELQDKILSRLFFTKLVSYFFVAEQ